MVKIEFNPPQLAEVSDIIPESVNAEGDLLRSGADKFLSATKDITQKAGAIQQKIGDFQSTYDEAKQKILNLKAKADSFSNQNLMGLGNNVTDYLNGKVTEDAILQNISIGNISMPLNSNLIQGAQSLFGVRTDLKFGKTTISAVFSEQRSQSQNVIAQGGGPFRNSVFLPLTMRKTVTTSWPNILGIITINSLKTIPTSIPQFRLQGLKFGLRTEGHKPETLEIL